MEFFCVSSGMYCLVWIGFILTSLLGDVRTYDGNKCFKLDTLPYMHKGMKMDQDSFEDLISTGPVDCARQCKLRSLCSNVNFNIKVLTCSLIAKYGSMITDDDYLTIDVSYWNDDVLESCKYHQCPNNTKCTTVTNSHWCEPIGCTQLPNVFNINTTSFLSKDLWRFGEVVPYACTRGYYNPRNATCTPTGDWIVFSCVQFRFCGETGICSERKSQEYWLYVPQLQSLHKIFCNAVNPLGPFLSLHGHTMSSTPPFHRENGTCNAISSTYPVMYGMGMTEYGKVRIKDNTIDHNFIISIFLNTTYKFQQIGRAGDCYAGNDSSVCGVIGRFIINTQGTGLRVKSTVQWKTWGDDGVIANVSRSEDGNIIEAYCGGNCGGCEPDGLILLEKDTNYTPPFDSADMLYCKYPL